jgi:hypothetical protein
MLFTLISMSARIGRSASPSPARLRPQYARTATAAAVAAKATIPESTTRDHLDDDDQLLAEIDSLPYDDIDDDDNDLASPPLSSSSSSHSTTRRTYTYSFNSSSTGDSERGKTSTEPISSVPINFGARDGATIVNKSTILSEIDNILGVSKPPSLEVFIVEPAKRSFLGTNWFGHALVRYQWSSDDVTHESKVGNDPTSLPSHHIQSCEKSKIASNGHWSCSVCIIHTHTTHSFSLCCNIIEMAILLLNSMIWL